ncbi:hypothetical protein MASR1M101_39660 [Gemmatimonas sp.]
MSSRQVLNKEGPDAVGIKEEAVGMVMRGDGDAPRGVHGSLTHRTHTRQVVAALDQTYRSEPYPRSRPCIVLPPGALIEPFVLY